MNVLSRRGFLASFGALASAPLLARARVSEGPTRGVIAIGFDIERMFDNEDLYFAEDPPPRHEVSYPGPKWDLTPACLQYVRKLMDIAEHYSVSLQFFALGHSVDSSPEIFHEILTRKHHLGQHTYSHLTLTADIGQVMDEVLRTQEIFVRRLGVKPFGLRAPGGYARGIDSLGPLQQKLKQAGIRYVSSRYDETKTLQEMQPYVLPSGLVEIPLYGYSDRNYSRHLQNTLSQWTAYLREQVKRTCEEKMIYSPALHPCLEAALDPEGKTLETIIVTAQAGPGSTWVTNLDDLALKILGE